MTLAAPRSPYTFPRHRSLCADEMLGRLGVTAALRAELGARSYYQVPR